MTRPSRLWALIAALLWSAGGPGIGPAIADDVQVNTYTTGAQVLPSVSHGPAGAFVVVWESEVPDGMDSTSWYIQGQRYAADGSKAGGEFQVNTYTTYLQRYPSVSMDAEGDFVVVWQSATSSGTDPSESIQARRYASDGSAVGGELQVNTYTTNFQRFPSVAMDADGDFVVVWHSEGSSGSPTGSVLGQRYASDGSASGGELRANDNIASSQFGPAVAMDPAGGFVVVWDGFGSSGTDSSGSSIQGRRYTSDGSAVGGEFQVNTYTTGGQVNPSVSVEADGDFVVVWVSYGSGGTDASGSSIQGQRYASDGSTIGGELQVNAYTTGYQFHPSVSVEADGDFVVVWESYSTSGGTDTFGFSVQGRRYASDGSAVGGQFQVNTYVTGHQFFPAVSVDAGGTFVAVWASEGSSGTDTSLLSVQRSDSPFFADGFESGDTTAWWSASP